MDMEVCSDTAYLYTEPIFDQEKSISKLEKNSIVRVVAKNKDGWYVVITYDKQTGFVYQSFLKQIVENKEYQPVEKKNLTYYAKITGNNINVRSSNSTKSSIIGFADKTDYFKILNYDGTWYQIEYLGDVGYIHGDYVNSIQLSEDEFNYQKMIYMNKDTYLYQDLGNSYISILPRYQNAFVLKEVSGFYQVSVDGIIGYVKKDNTKNLSKRCIVIDLSRQILKVYCNSKEIYRAKIISGRKSMQTNIGCFKIGHRNKNYTFKKSDIFNEYWLQFDNDIGLHPADANNGKGWQKKKYFEDNVDNAYNNWSNGNGKTFPKEHGSHGCVNMQLKDIEVVYNLVRVDDNVLVIGPNNLVRDNLISYRQDIVEEEKVKKLQYFG